MMTKFNNVVKVALVALTMMVSAQGACADDVTQAQVVEATSKPFGFATMNSRTDGGSKYTLTGGGVYQYADIKQMIDSLTAAGAYKPQGPAQAADVSYSYDDGKKMTVAVGDGTKTLVVFTSNGKADMGEAIKDAIADADIIVFDGKGGEAHEKDTREYNKRDFMFYAQQKLMGLSNKTIIGINKARLCTYWHITDVIKSWLNSVETTSGTGVSNASTSSGTGGDIPIYYYDSNGVLKEKGTQYIKEEQEQLTRKTLIERGKAAYDRVVAARAAGKDPTATDLESAEWLPTEKYHDSGVFYFGGCDNIIVRNISFQGPGSVDVGGVDLISIIDNNGSGSTHMWVDHCEFIDGQDGNFDITNQSDFITVSWCHFHYTDYSYVHQNTNLIGSDDSKTGDEGKLNITFANNEWGASCRSRMPMGRYGKIHLLNNWYNCSGNTENAVNPRKLSEFLIEGNYFAQGVTKTFKVQDALGVTIKDNTISDVKATTTPTASGTTVTVPYDYTLISSAKVPDMVDLLVGPTLDLIPSYAKKDGGVNPDNSADESENITATESAAGVKYYYTTNVNKAAAGLTFSVWATNTMSWQWYKATKADLSDAAAIDGATRNSYTLKTSDEGTIYLYCEATGVAGMVRSNVIKIEISSEGAPVFTTNLKSYKVGAIEATKSEQITLKVDAGNKATYQWYRNSVPSYDGATPIDVEENASAATDSYTYTAPNDDSTDFFFVVATNTYEENTYEAKSNIARVKYVGAGKTFITAEWIFDPDHGWEEAVLTESKTVNTTASDGTTCALEAIATDKTNKTTGSYNQQLQVASLGQDSSGNDIVWNVTTDGKEYTFTHRLLMCGKGDTTFRALKFNVSGSSKITVWGESTSSGTTRYLNIKYGSSAVVTTVFPFDAKAAVTYEYEGDATDIILYPAANINLYAVKVVTAIGSDDDVTQPYITTDVEDTYETTTTTSVDITIAADDAKTYKWYENTTASTEGAKQIEGADEATIKYTNTTVGTYYVYCVATNGTGENAKSVTSGFATVNVAKGEPLPVYLTYTWDMDNDKATDEKPAGKWVGFALAGNGKSNSYESVDDAGQIIEYYGSGGSITANKITIGGKDWTHYLTTGGGSTIDSGKENRVFKYHAPGSGKFTVYARGGGGSSRILYINGSRLTEGAANIDGYDADAKAQQNVALTYDIPDEEDVYVWATGSFLIYGIVAQIEDDATRVKAPSPKQGEWSADEAQTWSYTITSQTETAQLHYSINNGDETDVATNTIELHLSPGDNVKVYATDSKGTLTDSKTVTFTAAPTLAAQDPTIEVKTYIVSKKGFQVKFTSSDEGTIYYTLDGSAPTTSSPTIATGKSLYLPSNTTIKAFETKNYHANSGVQTGKTLSFTPPRGTEQTVKARGTGINNASATSGEKSVGVSYTVSGSYNAGAANKLKDGLKFVTNKDIAGKKKKGFEITVNSGFRITNVVAQKVTQNNTQGVITLNGVYVDGNYENNLLAEPKVLPYYGSNNDDNAIKIDAALNIDARQKIEFELEATVDGNNKKVSNNQANILFDIDYELIDSPQKVTIDGTVHEMSDFNEDHILAIDPASTVYDTKPTMVMTTTNGFEYEFEYDTTEGSITKYKYSLMGIDYYITAKVKGVEAPTISIADDLTLYGEGKAGYKVTLGGIATDARPFIMLDTDDTEKAVPYEEENEYYALKYVKTFCDFEFDGSEMRTDLRSADCPTNSYEIGKPFAIFLYEEGYSDSQVGGTTSSDWDPTKDQIHLGVADHFNVIDFHFPKSYADTPILQVRPDILNAKLVVLSEMLSGSSSYTYHNADMQPGGTTYFNFEDEESETNTNSTKLAMSYRDQLIGQVNVLNMKMFFYSQSKNNYQRWGWGQPITVDNTILSITPTYPMYEVFEDVAFNADGTLSLFKEQDEETDLNHFQLVHNLNEENEKLPAFIPLATLTDRSGEEYEALHYFKQNDYQYVATGISINDYLNYDENLRLLVGKISEMIAADKDLDSKMDGLPAPRIKDNGDGSATITNNSAVAVTYYRTSANANETWEPEDIKTNGAKTDDLKTKKYNSDVWVYAVSELNGKISSIAKVQIKGNPTRYFYRHNLDAEATGVDAAMPFTAKDGSAKVPYNQSFRKDGYTVTQWCDRSTGKVYDVNADYETTAATQDVHLDAIWKANEKKKTITDTEDAQSDAQRTVTWHFRRSNGAPALALEGNTSNPEVTGVIVGQMHFTDGTFIDVPMVIKADGSAVLPENGNTYTAKFNNKSDNYRTDDFAQVRTGTTFNFPGVYGMKVAYKPVRFEKPDGDNKFEASESYVTHSTLTNSKGKKAGTLTNAGLAMSNGVITEGEDGVTTVANNNLATGGIYTYNGTDSVAVLTSIESARYCAPTSGESSKTVGALNYGSVFMESLSVTYPKLYDLTTIIKYPDDREEISDEEGVTVELGDAIANCGGRYNDDDTLSVAITVTPAYSYYLESAESVAFDAKNSASLAKVGNVVKGTFKMKAGTTTTITVGQKKVYAYDVEVVPLDWGSVRINSGQGKDEKSEYKKFAADSLITITPTPKVGYQFEWWENEDGVAYKFDKYRSGENYVEEENRSVDEDGVLTIKVAKENSEVKYRARFIKGIEGTVTYDLPNAGLYVSKSQYKTFGATLDPGTLTDNVYPNYHFPGSHTTTAIYIPTNYTLYKPGYTLKNWVYIPDFQGEKLYEKKTEYFIGRYYYFTKDVKERLIMPIFKKNVLANGDSLRFDYRTTPVDITWDFRTAYYAQRMKFDTKTEFDYATRAVINGNDTIDVPLHIVGKADNTILDEWCHFDEGTEITIPSGLGAKFTVAAYSKLSSTTIDGDVPEDYEVVTENNIPVYYYTYTTKSTATEIKMLMGKDHTYVKSIRAQLPKADAVTLTTLSNNYAQGNITLETAKTRLGGDVAYTEQETENATTYTMPLGTYVTLKATRQRLYELKAFVVDGDSITMDNVADKEGFTMTAPGKDTTDKEYTLTFRLFSYATTVEAVYGERKKYQITFASGSLAQGEAPGVIVVEENETFDMPAKNQTLYLTGYTLKYWVDEAGNEYKWDQKGIKPTDNEFLTPVFDINDFTLFDITDNVTVNWPLAQYDNTNYGNAPLLKYQKSSGVYVSQLYIGNKWIDLGMQIDAISGKVDNSNEASNYRCQVNAGSVMTVPTNSNSRITVYTSHGALSTTKIAGSTTYSNTHFTDGEASDDNYAYVDYKGDAATQDIEFKGDAGYFKKISVTYGKVSTTDNLPKLDYVTIDNIALGAIGTDYEDNTLSDLIADKSMEVKIPLSPTATTMPVVKAAADRDDAIIEVMQATTTDTIATIIMMNKDRATVGIYKIVFAPQMTAVTAPKLKKVIMDGKLVMAEDLSGTLQNVLETGTTMSVSGTINLTFDHDMVATELTEKQTGTVKQAMSSSGGTTLSFKYWNLAVDKDYTFTIPAGTLKDAYQNKYGSDISFTFHTAMTSQHIDNRKVDFVVTHKQTHTYNVENPTEQYSSGPKTQVASTELIANLEKAGIAYGTIDEGIEMAHSTSATSRFYIFVPDGEYQLRGNTPSDKVNNTSNYTNECEAKNYYDQQIYSGITQIGRDNLSITGQSQDKTKLYNVPYLEGISYSSTFFVKGASNFYMQDMTLTNNFNYFTVYGKSNKGVAVVWRDRGIKTILKNVSMWSYQDTFYSNLSSNRYDDSRGYLENCKIAGVVDFVCGNGDYWFQNCEFILRDRKTNTADNFVAARQYEEHKWGYVFDHCTISAEDDDAYRVNNGKFTLGRPWSESPAASFLYTQLNVLPTDDGYGTMSTSGNKIRMHEYGSKDSNGILLDLSTRSLRASSPGAGSYAAVMTPAEAAEYTIQDALGGTDGYDPTLYTKQVSMAKANLTTVDRSLTWDAQTEALCYFIFRKAADGSYELYAVTEKDNYELDDTQIGKTFIVRAANQRGGLGEPSNELVYNVHESFKLTLLSTQKAPAAGEDTSDSKNWSSWSTIYLDYNAKAPTVEDEDAEKKVYVYAVVGVTSTSISLKRVDVLEKNQGYIVRGDVGTYTFSYTDKDGKFWDGTDADDYDELSKLGRMSVLDGTVENELRDGRDVYTLYYKETYGLGFYSYTGRLLNANKAYLEGNYVSSGAGIPVSGSGDSSGFIILDDDKPTTIRRVESAADDDSERIYTIYGQRVKRSEMVKGRVYIVNGRKLAY